MQGSTSVSSESSYLKFSVGSWGEARTTKSSLYKAGQLSGGLSLKKPDREETRLSARNVCL